MPEGHSMGGKSSGRQRGKKYSSYQRPAETTRRAKRGKVPKTTVGYSLGAGAKRGQAGQKKGCVVLALAGLGGLLGLTYGAVEVVRSFV